MNAPNDAQNASLFKLGVDAWNLADDRRGMGRYVRNVLADWRGDSSVELTLIVRKSEHIEPLSREFGYRVEQGVHRTFDAIWYPWNAMRFDPEGAKSIVLFHDAFAFTQPHRDWVARRREQAPIRRAMECADARATNSAWSAAELARVFHLDPSLFTVIHPVPDPLWQPVDVPVHAPYVLTVAGPEERKNMPMLFRAFARAFPKGACRLVVAGNLSGRDAWALERAGIAHERVQPTDEELRALYSGALLVAVPSSAEGYGFMTVEAMACGAPVLASNAAALPEACDGAAILVPPADLEGWSFALERMVNDAVLRKTMREQSLARVARIDRHAPARLTLELARRSLSSVR